MSSSVVSPATAQPPSPTAELPANRSSNGLNLVERPVGDQDQEVEYLTRGQMHEAFAEPYQADPNSTPVVATQPPEPINELPPDYRPDGDDVVWISGYWAWDDERTDFIWVSGVWRDLPPGERWVPGYWHQTPNGYQYVGGFWIADDVADVAYLPTPPESLDLGPSSPSPGEDYFYVPGSWFYQNNDYQWQPGYWSGVQENWVWNPARYVWTPRGCIHQRGFWDYDVPYRGVLFSPVYYRQPIYQNLNYFYRPQYSINTGLGLFVNMFVQSSNSHYFYGDYYGSQHASRYYPWVTRFQGSQYYDPFYSTYNNRASGSFFGGRGFNGTSLISWIGNQHQLFANNVQYRPATTISSQRQFMLENRNSGIDATTLHLAAVGNSFQSLVESNDVGLNFRRLDRGELNEVRDDMKPLKQLERQRAQLESSLAKVSTSAETDPARIKGDKPETSTNVAAEQRGTLRVPVRDRSASAERDRKINNRGNLDIAGQEDRVRQTAENTGPQTRNQTAEATDRGKTNVDSEKAKVDRSDATKARGQTPNLSNRGNSSGDNLPDFKREDESPIRQRGSGSSNTNRLDDLRTVRPKNIPAMPQRNRSRPIPSRPGEAATGGNAIASPDATRVNPRSRLEPQSRPGVSRTRPDELRNRPAAPQIRQGATRVPQPIRQNGNAGGKAPGTDRKSAASPPAKSNEKASRAAEGAARGNKAKKKPTGG